MITARDLVFMVGMVLSIFGGIGSLVVAFMASIPIGLMATLALGLATVLVASAFD